MKKDKLNRILDKLFPPRISNTELKKIQEENKLESIDLTGFEFSGKFHADSSQLIGPIDMSKFNKLDIDKMYDELKELYKANGISFNIEGGINARP